VYFAGDHLEGLAIEEEMAVSGAEGGLLGGRGTEGENSQQREGRDCGEEAERD
jgi:hypothetical protein